MMNCRSCRYCAFDEYHQLHCYYHDNDPERIKSCSNYTRVIDDDYDTFC